MIPPSCPTAPCQRSSALEPTLRPFVSSNHLASVCEYISGATNHLSISCYQFPTLNFNPSSLRPDFLPRYGALYDNRGGR